MIILSVRGDDRQPRVIACTDLPSWSRWCGFCVQAMVRFESESPIVATIPGNRGLSD